MTNLLTNFFDAFFVDFGVQLGTLGAQQMHPEPKNDHFGAPLAGAGPRDRFLVNLGGILGAILGTILHTGGHLWQLVASFRYLFCGDVFYLVSSTCRGRSNVAQT